MKIKQKVSAAIHEDEIQEEIEKDELEAEIRYVDFNKLIAAIAYIDCRKSRYGDSK